MTTFLWIRTALALLGVAVWGWGYRVDDPQIRLVGMAILLVTLLLRFAPKRGRGEDHPPT